MAGIWSYTNSELKYNAKFLTIGTRYHWMWWTCHHLKPLNQIWMSFQKRWWCSTTRYWAWCRNDRGNSMACAMQETRLDNYKSPYWYYKSINCFVYFSLLNSIIIHPILWEKGFDQGSPISQKSAQTTGLWDIPVWVHLNLSPVEAVPLCINIYKHTLYVLRYTV